MAAAAINPELVTALKRLKLGRILDTLPERLVLADKQKMSLDDLLLLVLTDEIARRDSTAADNRARDAGLDPSMRLELWDKSSKVTFDKRMLAELVSLRFLEAHRHVVVLGPVGVGKTFVSQALSHIACRHGYNVRFVRADAMLRTLRQSRLDNSRDAEMVSLTSVDLIVVDDFALEPMTKEESKDVYQLFLERTGRASMIVTSNRDTAEWLAMSTMCCSRRAPSTDSRTPPTTSSSRASPTGLDSSPRSMLPTHPPPSQPTRHDLTRARDDADLGSSLPRSPRQHGWPAHLGGAGGAVKKSIDAVIDTRHPPSRSF